MRFLVLILWLCSLVVVASPAKLKGVAAQYAGMNLVIEAYDNFIAGTLNPIAVIHVDKKGVFECDVDVHEITLGFIDLGGYRAQMFIEPGVEYEIVLPPNVPRPDAERFNPFYQPEEILIGMVDREKSKLNMAINKLDEEYEDLFNKNAVDLVRRQFYRLGDEMITTLDSVDTGIDNEFYNQYLLYRKAVFFSLPRSRQVPLVIRNFFDSQEVGYNNPAYWDAVKSIFTGYLDSYQRTARGRKFGSVFNADNSFAAISQALGADTLFRNQAFREMLLLKHIYDSYYAGYIDVGRATLLLDDAVNSASDSRLRTMAVGISAKINYLRQGSPAPTFTLRNFKGKEVSLEDFKGKFVYLAFLHTENYACLKDMPALNAIQDRFKKDLVVLGVITNENQDNAESYFKKSKFSWIPLPFTFGQKIVFDYNISVLPSYFLINPEGKMSLSPAPKPDENFDKVYIDIFQSYRHQQIRKDNQKEKSIYDLFR